MKVEKYDVANWLDHWLIENTGLDSGVVSYIKLAILAGALVLVCWIAWAFTKKIIRQVLQRLAVNTKSDWDDIFIEKKVFDTAAHLLPAIIIDMLAPYIFGDFPAVIPVIQELTDIFIVIVSMAIGISVLSALKEILSTQKALKDKPIESFIQLGKLLVYIIGGILAISLLIGKSPLYLLSGIGAMAAILLLVFKDTILGFVASVQLSANNMVKVGDWVSMPNYGADGDVIAIQLTTVKIKNFDNTITTIPTYAFISDSFKNWRGMQESGGRRIKRSIKIKVDSIKFCSEEMVEKFKSYQLIKGYIEEREAEIAAFNKANNIDKKVLLNGRHMTNIGVFRRYAEMYLKNNPNINQEMMCMVRQLEPTEKGVALEVYAFSKDKVWLNYEGIMGDIFDHLLAVVPYFDLEVFQYPAGTDFSNPTALKKAVRGFLD